MKIFRQLFSIIFKFHFFVPSLLLFIRKIKNLHIIINEFLTAGYPVMRNIFHKLYLAFQKISSAPSFSYFIMAIIVLAGISVGLETSPYIKSKIGNILIILDQIILWIFVAELIINIGSFGSKPWKFFYSGWLIFDFMIVAVCFLPYFIPEANTAFFAVLRLARVLRLVKIFEKVPNLKILLHSLLKSLPSMSYVIALLILQFYIYAVIGVDVFGKHEPDWFGTIPLSMKTLFVVILEGWSWIYDLAGIQQAMAGGLPDFAISIYFVSFIFVGAMIFLNLFIGILTTEIQETKFSESQGRSKIYKTGHILIIGWSQKIYKIISELVEANKTKNKAFIVVIADKDPHEMEFEINSKVHDFMTTKIIYKKGSPVNASHLELTNPSKAKSIIVLAGDESVNPDVEMIKVLMALTQGNEPIGKSTHIVAELIDEEYKSIAESITLEKAIFIEVNTHISRIIAQTCLQPCLSRIINDIINYDGSEIYLEEIPKLSGKKFSEIMFSFNNCTPLGILTKDKQALVNPAPDTILNAGDQLIILAEDDASIKVNSKALEALPAISSKTLIASNKPKSILIIGYNQKVPYILKELDKYVPEYSRAVVIYDDLSFAEKIEKINISLDMLQASFIQFNPAAKDLFEHINPGEFNHLIILSPLMKFKDIQEADSQVILSLIQARNIRKKMNYKFSILAEILNIQNKELVAKNSNDDFIVSAEFISSLIAQLSQNKDLKRVFEIIFSREGSEIFIRPAGFYIKLDTEITFSDVMAAVLANNETAIGFIRFHNGKMESYVNPGKNTKITLTSKDKIIVLSETIIYDAVYELLEN